MPSKRLIKDICQIFKNPLNDQGIFYKHDDEKVNLGYCMIIGPSDTPYQNGYYFFKFEYPEEYPFVPPKVTFYNNDKNTRFHPNLYRNGKVCLSILNTWKGEQWTSCQNISTVLLTILSILNDTPLLNEPGITKAHRDYNNYNLLITYKNIEHSILSNLIAFIDTTTIFRCFKDELINHFIKSKNQIKEQIEKMKNFDNKEISTSIYRMDVKLVYKILVENYETVCNLYK